MASIDIMLRKLAYIHTVCDDARKEKQAEEADKKVDNFTRQKKKIARDIREVKLMIEDRDAMVAESGSRADQAKMSFSIRNRMKQIKQDIEILKKIQVKTAEKYKDKKLKDEVQAKLDRQKEIVDIAFGNMKKVENLERFGQAENPQAELFSGGVDEDGNEIDNGDGQVLIGEIPDLDDVDFRDLRQKDQELDQGLSDILENLKIVKGLALEMGEELNKQDEMLDKLEKNVEKTYFNLASMNKRLTELLKKTRAPKDCCCDIFLIICILGIAAAIVYLFTS
eukprot:TRINITY_DN1225_c0_g1_i2.p1 TRINITY_DN1225_c0_g1~~TRINITY_DN1225_c0_g1_i2.p1  ORF type:complete len:281 (+),score=90.71 TRINITY_DN1225_c0_g1_i2:79-921(+)